MSNAFDYIDISIDTDNNNFCLHDKLTLKISIKNKSDVIVENGLFRLILDTNIFRVLDENFKVCIKDFGSIDSINPQESINFEIPIEIKEVPKEQNLTISALLNFHIIDKVNNIIDLNCKSNDLIVSLIDLNILKEDDFKYYIDKNEVFENDIITHTISIKNNTNTTISNLFLTYNCDSKFEFIKNSITVNEIYRVLEDMSTPLILGELDPNEDAIINFKTKVYNSHDSVSANFSINYDTSRRNISQVSNIQEYKVLNPIFNDTSFIKTLDKDLYLLDDICETTIHLNNIGNTSAYNVILKDSLLPNLEFINNSLLVNNVKSDNDIFYDGLYFDKLEPNKRVTIKYKSKAIDICKSKKTNAFITYSIENKDEPCNAYSSKSNLSILGAKIGNNNIKKELSSYSCQIGDIITARITIENTGNIDCESLKVSETFNKSLELIEGSLFINNKQELEDNIFNGINIDRVKSLETTVITYQIKVLDFPKPNPIIDRTKLTYSFILGDKLQSGVVYSTKSKLYINNPDMYIVDNNAVLKDNEFSKICHCGDYLFFSFLIENVGNVGLESIILNLNLPKDLSLNVESVKINNSLYNKKFKNTLELPNLNVAQKIHVDFFVKHSLIKDYNLESSFYFEYIFRDLQTKTPFKKSTKFKSNIVIINPDIEITKFVSDQDIEIDREFTKNINLTNTGNIVLEDIKLNLNESNFLQNSDTTIFVNGEYIDRSSIINFDKLDINETINIAIRYNTIDISLCESTLPESEVFANYYLFDKNKPIPIRKKSNKLKLDIKNYKLDSKCKCSSNILMLDNIYRYTISIVNTGNINCDLVNLDINIPSCLEYIKDSLCSNSKNLNLNKICSNISIDSLKCNESINVIFDFIVKSIPFKGQAEIGLAVYGKYKLLDKTVKKTFISEETILNIESLSLDVVKSVSHNNLQAGDILQIQTIINNTGTIDIESLNIQDNRDPNLTFVENSVYIDGENIEDINPVEGIKLKDLNFGENILLSYEYEYIPKVCSNKISHFSEVIYSYTITDKDQKSVKLKSDIIYLEGALSTFKQFNIDNEYSLKEYEPDIYDVVNIVTDAKVEDFYEISSIKNKSFDNSNSTGKKVIIKGFIMDRVEYLIKNEHSSLYMLERTHPFTVFINLPPDYDSDNIYFRAKCDDIFHKTTGPRGIFVSSLISIEGII